MLTVALVAGALPAAAEEFGAVVDYPLVFPVDGEHGFTDGFWVRRPGGRTHSSQDIFADKGVPVVASNDVHSIHFLHLDLSKLHRWLYHHPVCKVFRLRLHPWICIL